MTSLRLIYTSDFVLSWPALENKSFSALKTKPQLNSKSDSRVNENTYLREYNKSPLSATKCLVCRSLVANADPMNNLPPYGLVALYLMSLRTKTAQGWPQNYAMLSLRGRVRHSSTSNVVMPSVIAFNVRRQQSEGSFLNKVERFTI